MGAAVYVGIAAVGALTSPAGHMLVTAPLCGLFAAGVVAIVNPDFPADRHSRRVAAHAAAIGSASIPFANGLGLLGPAGGALVMGLLLLGCLRVASWILDWGAVADPEPDPGHGDGTAQPLAEMSVADLLEQWSVSERVLRTNPDAAMRVRTVGLRAALLDELSARDPDGTRSWIAAGGAAPRQHVREERGPAG